MLARETADWLDAASEGDDLWSRLLYVTEKGSADEICREVARARRHLEMCADQLTAQVWEEHAQEATDLAECLDLSLEGCDWLVDLADADAAERCWRTARRLARRLDCDLRETGDDLLDVTA